MAVAAPSDRRFRRPHVKPAHRKRAWSAGRWKAVRALLLAVGVSYAAYRGASLILDADVLRVGKVTVRGNERLSTGELLALVEGLRGRSIIRIDLDEWRTRLLETPWIADATLRRSLPSTVEVAIVERHPMGVGRLGGGLYLVDEQGTVIDEYGPNYAELNLPLIDGLAGPPRDGGPAIDEARAALAARLLQALKVKPDIARRVSQIDVTDPRDAVVMLDKETALVRLGDEQFLERLQSYIELAPALRQRVPQIDYVDLRFGERVYVGPAARQGAPEPAQAVARAAKAARF